MDALGDPDQGGGYDQGYPGLWGSIHYRANTNCDAALNAFDIDPFALKLGNPAAWYATYTCEDPNCPYVPELADGGGDLTAAQTAALLEQFVAPTRQRLAAQMVAEVAEGLGDTPRGEFWRAVLAELQ